MSQVAAVDLGATSGRVMLADIGPDHLDMAAVARFPNDPVRVWNGSRNALHWDITGLYSQVCRGLTAAARAADELAGIGVDSWAVDYGLLRDGRLLGTPHHYRDDRTATGVDLVHAVVEPEKLYRRNGIQFLPFNTVYQLAVERADGLLDSADTVLLVPDLISYWLTGRAAAERTNVSTTGLLGLDGDWDTALMHRIGLRPSLFRDLVEPGSVLGAVQPDIAASLGIPGDVRVASVGSHDTASAVAAVPMRPDRSAYISCGTWGLVGVELPAPVVTDESRSANFTNEIGVEGRVRFLRNVMGTWLLSETVRQYERDGAPADLAVLLDQAAAASAPVEVFDTDDPRFLPPGDMPARIASWYRERGLTAPDGPAETVRAIVESLAAAFAAAVATAARLSGVDVTTVHMVGGGCRNTLLCQLTADRLGRPLLAGPVEATALGNVLLTARATGLVDGDLEALRALVADRFPATRYVPSGAMVSW
ncbi:rhamnulokinase [Mycolicibacterium litorale]|uniref:rhamnulokinase n=1 Tax=Mycolicibacterium litorale TaxID=758802 RepID=UPI001065B272|nr:rhamnulokinase family protein [Mycolicibacterium litorale]MCV7418394.1 rhamnulokinase [Mycolicibacterium litorale]TDY06209.1 rhamnulokinase [Mycolicibacterium litorale]